MQFFNRRHAILALLIFPAMNALAAYREPCRVSYETEDGWSRKYDVECTYMTGFELNTATSTFNYQGFSTYAVVFWSQNQASVIRLTNTFFCGMETSDGCVTSFSTVRGVDKPGRTWKVCLQDQIFCL